MDTDRCRLGGTAAERTAMPSSSVMSRCRAMSRAVDSVAVAVSPSKHRTPNRSLSTYEHAYVMSLLRNILIQTFTSDFERERVSNVGKPLRI